jgi:transposase-like protein
MKNVPRSGKQHRPKTAIRGKRYRCATCHTSRHKLAVGGRGKAIDGVSRPLAGLTPLRPIHPRD